MIDPNEINTIFLDCLFENDELNEVGLLEIEVEGILNTFWFHPGKIKKWEVRITEILNELPDNFKQSVGGGWSFLNACQTKDGEQWTGLHKIMDQLFCLGMAIKKVRYTLPREMWNLLPGEMPYMVILDNENKEE